jgi:chromate transporter
VRPAAASPELGGAPALEVLRAFLGLGIRAFGGPVAHLGYFREEFVVRRRWLAEPGYAELIALCQFLPGPASSQVGFAIGLRRAGYAGALCAWLGFTLPSAILMTAFAFVATSLNSVAQRGVLHGLKLVAVVIVAQAVLGMARTLCLDVARALIAVLALGVALQLRGLAGQLLVMAGGALLGALLCRRAGGAAQAPAAAIPVSRRAGGVALALFLGLLLALPLLQRELHSAPLGLFSAFYRSGALVFGGGHVVLPLLRAAFVPPGWVSDGDFLAGYGAAQALPGPLFSFAAYLGAIARPWTHPLVGAALGLLGIFLPGMLILVAALPLWRELTRRAPARAAILGVNAAVVGLLAAALYDPVWVSAVQSDADWVLVLVGFALLTLARWPPWMVVLLTACAGAACARPA